MGILLVVNRYLASNSKSQFLKSLFSSNLLFIRSISSPAVHDSAAGLCEAQIQAPTLIDGDLKSNNKKPMFLTQHFHGNYNKEDSWDPSPPPYNHSLISAAENSWKDHRSLCNPFSGLGEYSLADSCNELMLVFFVGKTGLWNPTTNKIKILPESDVPAPLPVPASTTTIAHGFGFDPESEDYKVLRFLVYDYEDGMDSFCDFPNVEVYSLKTNSWKKITHHCYRVPRLQKPSVQVNGVYYWGGFLGTPFTILSFDFANEKFSSIPLPPKLDDEHNKEHYKEHSKWLFDFECGFVLVEFDGLLAALVHSELKNTEKRFSFEVWGWNGESWLKKMSRIAIDVPSGVVKVLGLFQDDKLFLQGFNKGELMLFHLAKRKLESLGIHANPHDVTIFPYVGSSVLFHTMRDK